MSNGSVEVLTEKFDSFSKECTQKLSELHTDIVVIKRDVSRVERLDKLVRGNGAKGLVTRVSSLEDKGSGKEKYAYMIIGGLVSGLFALGVILITIH